MELRSTLSGESDPRFIGQDGPFLTLSYYDEAGQVREFHAPGDSMTVGADPMCDLTIPGLAPTACQIYLAEGGFYADDLGGGVDVDGRPGSDYVRDESTLTLGGWLSLRVAVDAEPVARASAGRRPKSPPEGRQEVWIAEGARRHRPGVAVALAVLPGGGQAYNGQIIKAVVFLMTSPLILPWIWSFFDARSVAKGIVAAGGITGQGGLPWFLLHLWFVVNILLLTTIVLTMAGVLQ